MSTAHTPAQAAQIAEVSRSTISRAIKRGKLLAIKGNQGWQISDDELRKWMGAQKVVQRTSAAHVQDHPDAGRVAVLETENRMLKERVEELRTERDDWKAQASRRWWDFMRR
jgi:excisionase family DNA binding protein